MAEADKRMKKECKGTTIVRVALAAQAVLDAMVVRTDRMKGPKDRQMAYCSSDYTGKELWAEEVESQV